MASDMSGTRARYLPITLLPVAASLSLLPISICLLCLHLAREAIGRAARQCITYLLHRIPSDPSTKVIVTGARSPEGLAIARLLHDAGHSVLAADLEAIPYTSPARASKAFDKFYAISRDGSLMSGAVNAAATELFSTNLRHIIQHERPCVWIPCGNLLDDDAVSKIRDQVEKDTQCRVLYPSLSTLNLLTNEERFYDFVLNMDAGLLAPEVRLVSSRSAIHRALGAWPMKRRFILEKQEPLTAEELSASATGLSRHASRASRPLSIASSVSTLTVNSDFSGHAETVDEYTSLEALILPSSSMSDTYNRIASIKISRSEPWMLQELVSGLQFTAHCLVITNEMQSLTVSSLSSGRTQMTMSSNAALHTRIHEFMQKFVQHLPPKTSMHLNVRFVLSEISATHGVEQKLYPVSCDFKPCTAGFLFGEKFSKSTPRHLADIYQLMVSSENIGTNSSEPHQRTSSNTGDVEVLAHSFPPPLYGSSESNVSRHAGYYSLPASILHLVMLPVLRLTLLQDSITDVLEAVGEFLSRLVNGKEEYFEWRDPWPWIWKWFVGWPLETLSGLHSGEEDLHEK